MNLIRTSIQFFKESYYELTKVTWLGKKEVVGTTIIVIIFVIIMSIFVSVVDLFLGTVVGIIL
ncbi:preprotein translocase subunit SecE [Candidatus Endomicrobiellum trichonymphae]|uniref:Protein translocase subunit SecE n=1 Tax=Endomicrobium trichonymphae TaxID=1408204 RepID=B1GZN0_ENDTX|nr:preprotein translocase subunit SecE [Candidatus Endomicrobium trichonymphae]BAG13712.1 protein translocase subunit SecE [Candidatus Endomicrobium trichonymphae]